MQKSNEELAILLQRGKSQYAGELWSGVEKLARYWVQRFYTRYQDRYRARGIETGDLMQCSYLAMVEAVEKYDMSVGCKFSTFFCIYLKKELWDCLGYRTAAQRYDAQPAALSLERQIIEGEEGLTLGDTVADDTAENALQAVIDTVYNEKAREDIAAARAHLNADEDGIISRVFYRGQTVAEIAKETGQKYGRISRLYSGALRKMYHAKELREYREEYTVNLAYRATGLQAFLEWNGSSVEQAVLRLYDLDEKTCRAY